MGLINGSMPTKAQIVGWLQRQLDLGKSPATVAIYRRILRAVIRWGAAEGHCLPISLPPIRQTQKPPEAWTVEQVSRILHVASKQPGLIAGRSAADWWTALILLIYWTGARIGSVLEIRPADYDPIKQTLTIRRTKTGKQTVCRLHDQAAQAIKQIYDAMADRLFIWPHHRRTLWAAFRRIVEQAGVPAPKNTRTGLFHRLRKTCLSYCWAADPAIAQRQADHSSAEITRRHYVDPRLVQAEARQAADVLPVPDWQPGPQQRFLFS